MTDIQNPTTWSDYDFLEFEAFASKVGREGFTYAYENYGPDFETAELQATAADLSAFRAFYREHASLVEQWWATVGGKRGCDLHNAHIDEARQREQDACLWGVRCADGHVVHVESEAARTANVALLLSDPSYRQPAALLHRDVPGGEWTVSPLASEPAE